MAPFHTKVGFVGTGNYGRANGRNLDGPGFAVTAWNRSREKANALGSGIRTADANRKAAEVQGAAVFVLRL